MSFEEAIGKTQQWGLTAETLGALGAYLALADGDGGDPGVRQHLGELLGAAGLSDVGAIEPPQRAMLKALVRSSLLQALELVEAPERPPGWVYTDPGVLDGWGRGSSAVPGMIAQVAPEIGSVTSLLDVGTGVGLLAVGATAVWPDVTVVGIDTWQPSLDRARTHIDQAGLGDRITVRKQDVADVDDVEAYDCVWVPTFFLTEPTLEAAVTALHRSLKPGGWLVLGRFLPVADPVGDAMLRLRTYRSGGSLVDEQHSIELLEKAGCTGVRAVDAPPPVPMGFTIGQKSG